MTLRHHPISKLLAASFVVLILLPFTAPFQTVELAAPAGSAAHQAAWSVTEKLAKDVADVPSTLLVRRDALDVPRELIPPAESGSKRPHLLGILRL